MSPLTVSESTKARYDKVVKSMIKRLVGTGYCSCVHGIAIWIKKQAEFGTLRASTLRQYKAAMIHYLQGVDGEEVSNALDVLKEIKNIPRRVNGTLIPKRTSAKKLKHISLQDEQKFLREWLPSRKSKSAQMLRIWLLASLNTGLRPCEWEHAVYRLDRPVGPVLIVRNAKATNGRAHGDSRTLLLAELEPILLDAILSLIRIISEHIATGASFAELQKSMSNAVYRESRKCWPRRENHISLYTMRHQFSANMKATEIGRQELAAIMGHATDRTAGLHYARKVTGRKVTYHVTPLAHEVSRVKNRYSAFAQGKPKGIRLKGP